ncbi:outer membrane beta-barrel protein [Alcanivorax sp. S71-1-4]|uniref:outer membrane beta-barrel protein n=1 Tax=Alcanivorax sp. S71-1-4 TaxID=1177159 RepID=UPI001358266D|nr:outer membrane beta-barrel protein [Alcanivorax sp. S71-1-4]
MKKWKGCLVVLLTWGGMPALAAADQISYSHLEAGYQRMTGDGSFDGYFFRGAVQVTDSVYLAAGYDELEDSGVSQEIMTLRAGLAVPLQDGLDAYGELGLVRAEVAVSVPGLGTFSEKETGYQLEAGARMAMASRHELRGFLRSVDVDGYDETFLGAQGVLHVAPRVGVHAGVSRLFDASEFLFELGVRVNF